MYRPDCYVRGGFFVCIFLAETCAIAKLRSAAFVMVQNTKFKPKKLTHLPPLMHIFAGNDKEMGSLFCYSHPRADTYVWINTPRHEV